VITANKGEWAEFYVLLKLLIEKGFNGVDSDLEQIPDLFFSVIQIYGNDDNLIYELSDQNKILITSSGNSKLIDNKVVKERLGSILNTIVNTEKRTFAIPEAEELMQEILCTKIKSNSSEKGDIRLIFEEPQTKQILTDYFSIKSFLAGKPTLLNASTHTIFTYKVTDLSSEQIAEINNIFNSTGSIDLTKRIEKIYEYGGRLEFYDIASDTMEKNLKKIDSLFPFEIARMLRDSYIYRTKKILELTKGSEVEDINRKVGAFLEATLKGMMPGIEWDLLNIANGLILVINGGELVGFHLCNKRELVEYLVKNSYLDTPSTSRHKIGKIYSSQEKYLFDLSLQIRLF